MSSVEEILSRIDSKRHESFLNILHRRQIVGRIDGQNPIDTLKIFVHLHKISLSKLEDLVRVWEIYKDEENPFGLSDKGKIALENLQKQITEALQDVSPSFEWFGSVTLPKPTPRQDGKDYYEIDVISSCLQIFQLLCKDSGQIMKGYASIFEGREEFLKNESLSKAYRVRALSGKNSLSSYQIAFMHLLYSRLRDLLGNRLILCSEMGKDQFIFSAESIDEKDLASVLEKYKGMIRLTKFRVQHLALKSSVYKSKQIEIWHFKDTFRVYGAHSKYLPDLARML